MPRVRRLLVTSSRLSARHLGMTALDVVKLTQLRKTIMVLCLCIKYCKDTLYPRTLTQIKLALGFVCNYYMSISTLDIREVTFFRPSNQRTHVTFDDINNANCFEMTRFKKKDFNRIRECWNLPATFSCDNRSYFTADEAILLASSISIQ